MDYFRCLFWSRQFCAYAWCTTLLLLALLSLYTHSYRECPCNVSVNAYRQLSVSLHQGITTNNTDYNFEILSVPFIATICFCSIIQNISIISIQQYASRFSIAKIIIILTPCADEALDFNQFWRGNCIVPILYTICLLQRRQIAVVLVLTKKVVQLHYHWTFEFFCSDKQ